MKAAHVATDVSDPAAGTTYSVLRLCQALGRRGLDIDLYTLEPGPVDLPADYRCMAHRRGGLPPGVAASRELWSELQNRRNEFDIVHNHGLWRMPNLYAGWIAKGRGIPHICSTHGMLAPAALRRSAWQKALFGVAGQRSVLEAATCFHATSSEEVRDIRRAGLRQPIALVPFGIDLPAAAGHGSGAVRRTLLFLGRIDPIKRIDVLLVAWRAVQDAFPEWDLTICGPDGGGHLAALRKLAAQLGTERVDFPGPRFGAQKSELLAGSSLLVLPSFSENFGLVVGEALAHGTPTIVTNSAPWQGLVAHGCGWWIDQGPEALESALREALSLDPGALGAMGRRGRDWIERDFSWATIAGRMEDTYRWLRGLTGAPVWVTME